MQVNDVFGQIVLPCIYSFIASIAFGVQFNIKLRHMIAAGIGGMLCQFIFLAFEFSGTNEMLCYFFSAAAVSMYSEVMARRIHVPVNMYLVIGIIPLVPGGAIYNTMITLIGGDINLFSQRFTNTIGMAGAIAMGVFAVSSIVRLVRLIMKKAI